MTISIVIDNIKNNLNRLTISNIRKENIINNINTTNIIKGIIDKIDNTIGKIKRINLNIKRIRISILKKNLRIIRNWKGLQKDRIKIKNILIKK